jgi:hypothetical protein
LSRRCRCHAARTSHPIARASLDGLCGLYAIINAIRLATHHRTGEFSHAVWRELLLALISEAESVVGTATAVVHGIGTKPLYELAKAAERHLASEHGVAVTVSRSRGPKHSFDGLIAHLAELTKQPGSAVVLELSGDVRHWTVLRRVGKHSLELFDSSGMERVRLASCRLQHEWAHNGSREYVMRRRRVLLIVGDDSSC